MPMRHKNRIHLSPPYVTGHERPFVEEAFRSNWIAPLGPNVDAFEEEFARAVGIPHAVAVNSGTAAIHLAFGLVGVGAGDDVLASTLTFAGSIYPILYLGARPVFIDSERLSWNMDPVLLREELAARASGGRLPRAVLLVHLYGQTADIDPILQVCDEYGVPLVEDAAEALGSTYKGRSAGTFGRAGAYSFNGNKIVTTSGGGMLVSEDAGLIAHARKLASQARDAAPHYQHSEIGFNYRLSNVLAGIGRGQLLTLEERVRARRRNFDYYRRHLGDLPGVEFMPEAPWGRHTRWLSCLLIDRGLCGVDRETIRRGLEAEGIESRPVWKPMHLQPVFAGSDRVGGRVAEDLFERGLCLPSGSGLTEDDLERVVTAFRDCVTGIACGQSREGLHER